MQLWLQVATKLRAFLFVPRARRTLRMCLLVSPSSIRICTLTPRRWAAISFLATLPRSNRYCAIRISPPAGVASMALLSWVMIGELLLPSIRAGC